MAQVKLKLLKSQRRRATEQKLEKKESELLMPPLTNSSLRV